MRRIALITMLFIGWALECNAQRPYWVKKLPETNNGNFYYRATMAEGYTYKDAYAEAFAIAIYESYSKLVGVKVQINSDEKTIKEGVMAAISSVDDYIQLPINKVCEYEERVGTSNKIRLYVLWQVADNALIDPKFENFTKCE